MLMRALNFILLFLAFPALLEAQVSFRTQVVGEYTRDFRFLDPARGFIVFPATIATTNDSGSSWSYDTLWTLDYSQGIRSVVANSLDNLSVFGISYCADDRNEYWSASTMDGGAIWEFENIECKFARPEVTSLHARSGTDYKMLPPYWDDTHDDQVFLARRADGVYRSMDGAWSWSKVNTHPLDSTLILLRAIDNGKWYLLSTLSTYMSFDDGSTWMRQGPAMPFTDVRFSDNGVGFAVGPFRGFAKSTDAGLTWRTTPSELFRGHSMVRAFNDSTAYFATSFSFIQAFGHQTDSLPLLEMTTVPKGEELRLIITYGDDQAKGRIRLGNFSSVPLSIDSVVLNADGLTLTDIPSVIEPWQTSEVTVTWNYKAGDNKIGYSKCYVYSKSALGIDSIGVYREYLEPELSSKAELDFGEVFIGDTVLQVFAVNNYRTIDSFQLRSSKPRSTTVWHQVDTNAILQSHIVRVWYAPSDLSELSDSIRFIDADSISTSLTKLKGRGILKPAQPTVKVQISASSNFSIKSLLSGTGRLVAFLDRRKHLLFGDRRYDYAVANVEDIGMYTPLPFFLSAVRGAEASLGMDNLLYVTSVLDGVEMQFSSISASGIQVDSLYRTHGLYNLASGAFGQHPPVITTEAILLPHQVSSQPHEGEAVAEIFNFDGTHSRTTFGYSCMGRWQFIINRVIAVKPLLPGRVGWILNICGFGPGLWITDLAGNVQDEGVGWPVTTFVGDGKGGVYLSDHDSIRYIATDGNTPWVFHGLRGHSPRLIVDREGYLLSAGVAYSVRGSRVVVERISSNGVLLWRKFFNDKSYLGDSVRHFHVRGDTVWMTGRSGPTDSITYTMGYDLQSGNELFFDRQVQPMGTQWHLRTSAIDSSGNYWIGGHSISSGDTSLLLIKYGTKLPPAKVPAPSDKQFHVYPNPSAGEFTIEVPEAFGPAASYTLIDLLGRDIMRGNIPSQLHKVKVNVPAGVYLLRIFHSGETLHRAISIK